MDLLQHPRRNLGNRYRSQARKFLRLADKDSTRFNDNVSWAEQNARQAILYDFTNEDNWRCLVEIKIILQDEKGLNAVLEDVFCILGRDPEHIEQLKQVDFLQFGNELLEAAFARDPLNPDVWWEQVNSTADGIESLDDFVLRCQRLDFRDQRANILFGRRIERIRDSGQTSLFIDLARNLLAHRPQNHELWLELGRLYERLERFDEAWICYDHVQSLRAHSTVRDDYMSRLSKKMDGNPTMNWTRPEISKRQEFLDQMLLLSSRVSSIPGEETINSDNVVEGNKSKQRLITLLEEEDFSSAFFLARSLVAQGEDWAADYMQQARQGLD